MASGWGHLLRPVPSTFTQPPLAFPWPYGEGFQEASTHLQWGPCFGGRSGAPWQALAGGTLRSSLPPHRWQLSPGAEGLRWGRQAPGSKPACALPGLCLGWGKNKGLGKHGSLVEDGQINNYLPGFRKGVPLHEGSGHAKPWGEVQRQWLGSWAGAAGQ